LFVGPVFVATLSALLPLLRGRGEFVGAENLHLSLTIYGKGNAKFPKNLSSNTSVARPFRA
jgi:hypothetical protein